MKSSLFFEEENGVLYYFKGGEYYPIQINPIVVGGGGGKRGPRGPQGPSGDAAPSYQATATNDITTASTTDVLATDMTITPPAGTYLVWFSGSAENTINVGSSSVFYVSIYSGGVQVASSEEKAGVAATSDGALPFTSIAKVTVDGAQAIEGKWRTWNALDTATMHQRNLTILKVA